MDRTTTTVSAVRSVGTDTVAIDLETPAGLAARPGQFVKFTLPAIEDEPRFYTVSSPDVEATFEITVEIDYDGELGPRIAELAAGDEVAISGPFGSAYYEDEERVVVLAGGPGVGPAVAIAERVLADGGSAAVVYRDDEHVHRDRLDGVADAGGFVSLVPAGSAMADDVSAGFDAVGADAQVFVYGFADFLDVATDAIEAAGGDAGAAKVENFG